MRKFLLSSLALLACTSTWAQVVNIIDGGAASCAGTLVDSGGDTGTGYGPDENHTLVLYPDGAGQAIRLSFGAEGLALGPGDVLTVYDGTDTNAEVLVVYTGAMPDVGVEATFANTVANGQGVLTLVFTSDATGHGSFEATITCFTPCNPPVADASLVGHTVPAMVCIGESVSFDGSASQAAETFNIVSYTWDFRDGSAPVSGTTAVHAFDAPGEYNVRLTVVDDNACANANQVDVRVRVGTVPEFTLSATDRAICVGEEVVLTASVESPTWTNVPQPFVEGLTALPDGSGITYTSQVTVSGFTPGLNITQPTDVVEVCAVLEHSYVGDLICRITSPGGQQVLLFNGNNANPLATYLGNALDEPPHTLGEPGEGWTYCFANTGELLTLAAEISAGNTVLAGDPESGTAIEGQYTSEGSFTGLAGGPINGTWTISITDDQGADDGFITSWWIAINPLLYPDVVSFTPTYGAGPDSTAWTGPNIVQSDAGADVITVAPQSVGAAVYTYTATNDFGCTFDTTLTITVTPGVTAPIVINGDTEICQGSATQLSAPGGYTNYVWSNGFQGQNISATPGTYTVTVYSGDCSLASEPLTITAIPVATPVISGPGFNCGGEPATLATTAPFPAYSWSNGAQTPTVTVGSGSYSVTITENGCSATSLPFNVQVGSDPQASITTDLTSPQGIGATVNFNGSGSQGVGSPLQSYEWDFGIPGQGSNSANTSYTFTGPGSFGVMLTVTAADGCQDSAVYNFVILPSAIFIPNVFTPNNDGDNDTWVIEGGQFYTNNLSVFNRWGKEVFTSKNYRNTWRAADVPEGTYYYVFRTEDDSKEYTGHLTILR